MLRRILQQLKSKLLPAKPANEKKIEFYFCLNGTVCVCKIIQDKRSKCYIRHLFVRKRDWSMKNTTSEEKSMLNESTINAMKSVDRGLITQ